MHYINILYCNDGSVLVQLVILHIVLKHSKREVKNKRNHECKV